jgi:hypothetical protein
MSTTEAASLASSSAAATWVSLLAVFPPKLRLELQKTISADVQAQEGQPPQAPLSRAYASGGGSHHTPSGLGAPATSAATSSVLRRSAVGGHVAAVSRTFPSTAEALAGLILTSAHLAKAEPRVPFDAGAGAEGASASAPSSVSDPHPERTALAAELRALGLDAAYRVPVARNLQRRLAGAGPAVPPTDRGWEAEAATGRFPNAVRLAKGEVAAAAQAALDARIAEAVARGEEAAAAAAGRAASGALAAAAAGGSGQAAGSASAELDAGDALDDALAELDLL